MIQRPLLLLHGALSSPNFGDVLLARITVGWIREHSDFEICAYKAAPAVLEELGIRPATVRDLFSADAYLLSGGGYFQTPLTGYRAHKRFLRHAGPVLLGQIRRRPTALIGVGAARLPHAAMRRGLRFLIDQAHTATVRDPRSHEASVAVGTRRPPTVTADLAFVQCRSILPPEACEEAAQLVSSVGSGQTIAVHLSGTPATSPDYANLYRALEESLMAAQQAGVLLIEDHPHAGSPQQQAQAHLHQRLGAGRSRIVPYRDSQSLSALLSAVDAVLTDKLHVGLVAAAMGTPPYSIAKHPKNLATYEAIGLGEHCILLERCDASRVRSLISRLLDPPDTFSIAPEVRERAGENERALRDFLRFAQEASVR